MALLEESDLNITADAVELIVDRVWKITSITILWCLNYLAYEQRCHVCTLLNIVMLAGRHSIKLIQKVMGG